MSKLNHFAISSILNSEVVGHGKFGHGQIESLEDAQRYFDMLATDESPANANEGESVDGDVIRCLKGVAVLTLPRTEGQGEARGAH